MENNTSQNQNKNTNTGSSDQNQQNRKTQNSESVLTLLQPHDMSRTVESALNVFQGRHEKLPELMQDVGTLLLKATKRFTTTQLILAAGALTIGAVLLASYSANNTADYEEAA